MNKIKILLSRMEILTLVGWLALMSVGPIHAQTADSGAFYRMCRSGSVEEVASAITAGADVNRRDDFGFTPLMGVLSGQVELAAAKAELLLSAGADPNLKSDRGITALHLAAGSGRVELARRLLASGAGVNAFDDDGFSPLLYACRGLVSGPEEARKKTIELLLESGADVRPGVMKESGQLSTPPLMAAASHSGPAIVELLLAAGCPVNLASHTGYTPLMAAAEFNGNPATTAALLAAGADPRQPDIWGDTALDLAAGNDTPAAGEIARMLEAALKKPTPMEKR